MEIPNPFRHTRTDPKRHSSLINNLRDVVLSDFSYSKRYVLDICILGPGGMPVGYSKIFETSEADTFLSKFRKKSSTSLENYEPQRILGRFVHRFNPNLTVIDSYLPCLDCIPDEMTILYTVSNNERLEKKVQITKLHHNIGLPIPQNVGPFDIFFAACSFDYVPHSDFRSIKTSPNYLRKFFTPARQEVAVHNADKLIRPGGYLAVTLGKDAPRYDLLLGNRFKEIDCGLAPGYQIWRKNYDAKPREFPKVIFRPEPTNVKIITGKNADGSDSFTMETFPRTTNYSPPHIK